MGFSGGGSNVLKPHTHDGTVSQDGGPLNLDNVTQASLTAGDTTFSDGVHLQRLAIGSVGDQYVVSASNVPEWSSSGSASMTLIQTLTQPSDSDTMTVTLSPVISSPDKVYVMFAGEWDDSQDLGVQINSLTSATYDTVGAKAGNPSGSLARVQIQNEVYAEFLDNNLSSDESIFGAFTIWSNPNQAKIQGTSHAGSNNGYEDVSWVNTTASQTSIDSITIRTSSPGADIRAGSVMSVYKISG
jgi:hypothetical protein